VLVEPTIGVGVRTMSSSDRRPRYDAFISYRRKDGKVFAERLREELLTYRLPESFGEHDAPSIYLDTIYERADPDFFDNTIRPALERSRALIVVQTPGAMEPGPGGGENWVVREIRHFRALEQGDNVWVALALGNFEDPLPADLSEELPHVERVDIRTMGDWLPPRVSEHELLKFVAPIHDVPPEKMPELRREAEKRARRRMTRTVTISATVAIVVTLLAIAALIGWRNAEQATREATARLVAAEVTTLVELRPDTALLLAARAYQMYPSAAVTQSWWDVMGHPAMPWAFLPVEGADLWFSGNELLVRTSAGGDVAYRIDAERLTASDGGPTPSVKDGAPPTLSVGGEQVDDREDGVWRCSGTFCRTIGPYGDCDDFCVASRLRPRDFCGGELVLPGHTVRLWQVGSWAKIDVSIYHADDDADRHYTGWLACEERTDGSNSVRLVAGERRLFDGVSSASSALEHVHDPASIAWVTVSADGRWTAVRRAGGRVEVWPGPPGSASGPAVLRLPVAGTVNALDAATTGHVAVAFEKDGDGKVAWWPDAADAARGDAARYVVEGWRRRPPDTLGVLRFSPDGRFLLGGESAFVDVWDVANGRSVARFDVGRMTIVDACVRDATDTVVLPRPLDGRLPVGPWPIAAGGPLSQPWATPANALAVACGPVGKIVAADSDGVRTWDVAGKKEDATWAEEPSVDVATDDAGRWYAIALADGSVRLVDATEATPRGASSPRSSKTNAIAILGGATGVARASASSLELWRPSGDEWLALSKEPHRDVVALSGGKLLALTGGAAVVYDVDPKSWLATTCRMVGRDLTEEEWAPYGDAGVEREGVCDF